MVDQEPKPVDYAAAARESAQPPLTVADEKTRGFCGWSVFAPQRQTWLGFILAWICVLAIIWLTKILAQIGS